MRSGEGDGLDYAWIDACCIDKTSSSEFTEAINSMFQWYQNSQVCYTWLSDLPKDKQLDECLKDCRWFTRGWTLQELIAPQNLEFYDEDWVFRGTKAHLSQSLTQITKIDGSTLQDPENLWQLPIAQRMYWAVKRQTTRIEDMAYCLLGIFDVNMPMLYGEGPRAFLRLQEEIAKDSNDLAYLLGERRQMMIRHTTAYSQLHRPNFFLISNKGLRIKTSLHAGVDGCYFLPLNCSLINSSGNEEEVGIWIKNHGGGVYSRVRAHEFGIANPNDYLNVRRVFLSKRIGTARSLDLEGSLSNAFIFRKGFNPPGSITNNTKPPPFPEFPFQLNTIMPREEWNSQQRMFQTRGNADFSAYGFFSFSKCSPEDADLADVQIFILAFGRTRGQEAPWIHIGTEEKDVYKHIGDVKKVGLAARKKGSRMALMRDNMDYFAKAVYVSFPDCVLHRYGVQGCPGRGSMGATRLCE